MRAIGHVIKLPDSGPGLLFVEGKQRRFVVEGMWMSSVAPALNQTVEVELNDAGEIASLRIADADDWETAQVRKANGPEVARAPDGASVAVKPSIADADDWETAQVRKANGPEVARAPDGASVAVLPVPVRPPTSEPVSVDPSIEAAKTKPGEGGGIPVGAKIAVGLVLAAFVVVVIAAVSTSDSSASSFSGSNMASTPPSPPPQNHDPDPASIRRARQFLDRNDVANNISTLFLHTGASFDGHTFQGIGALQDNTEGFALLYQFNWDRDGLTDVAFVCDPSGAISHLQVMKTNARGSPPFALAQIGGQFLSGVVQKLADDDDKMSPEDKATLKELVANPDVKKLLDFYLRAGQRVAEAAQ